MKRILLCLGLFLVLSKRCEGKLTKECLADYLKFSNIHDDILDSIDPYTGDPVTCSNDIRLKIADFYGETRSKMESNFKQKPYADCAMGEIETERYKNILLNAEVIELKGVGLKFWKISSKNSKIEELKKQAQNIVENALIKCKGQTDYGAFFDTFYEQKRFEPMSDDYDYCMRKHLVEKSVINPNLYNFKMNPKNVNIGYERCESIMKLALEQMRGNIENSGSSCVIDTFVDNGYLEQMMKIQLLSKLTLTQSEKNNEKNNFVNQMIEMTHKIISCPKS
ncbi:CLUMA_CG002659, isoform A [Clunio marinus]|uniref:CLUMA_CG002659, isoform A n=1 Tax=Clunio marinus TaxID=568069 RepID=A0A1J1HKX1_9DIPT|nr:CLUMA_CG002659, isoform A [Clunio marinus]